MENIEIKCPNCGAVLRVKNQERLEYKNVNCPVCKMKAPFKNFERLNELDCERTEYYDDNKGDRGQKANEDLPTNVSLGLNFTLGKLKILPSGPSFQLKKGRNVIGRKASQSIADFQIPFEGCRKLSREHLVVEIKKVQGKGLVHYVSLYKQKTNRTYIGDNLLEYGDCIVLNHGDVIKLPEVNLLFEIPDSEITETDY